MGRAIRSKSDYGIMILADRRFGRSEKYSKLPKWLRDNLSSASTNLSVEESLAISKKFLRQMAQPFPREDQIGIRSLGSSSLSLLLIVYESSFMTLIKFIGQRASNESFEKIGA